MTLIKLKMLLISLGFTLAACSEQNDKHGRIANTPEPQIAEQPRVSINNEPVDELGTQALNNKLLGRLEVLSSEQASSVEEESREALAELSESDRQAFIDLTIESSSKKVGEDADEVMESLKPQ